MSNIDKRALRERYSPKPAPECHICGKEMTIQRMSASRITYGCTGATYDDKGCHYAEGRSIADDHYEQSRVTVVDVSDPDVLALLDELEHYKSREERVTKLVLDNSTSWDVLYKKLEAAEHRIAEQSAIVAAAEKLVRCKGRYHSELNYRALAKLFGVITPDLPPLEHENVHYADAAEVEITALRQRIAELERSETQLINERDAAESALADMYQAATGERPEWSNMFGFADAVDVVEERLATLEANQSQTTPTGIQLITEAIGAHGYIVGCLLQGRPDLALEESRKWVSAFGQAAEIVSAQDADDIKVKGE
ncbi:ead/Ea22-like family protein [Salmonella enterica subsp. enterica serovar Typhimurium]|uniref:Ead/Ea22-like family protein n=6 Tax=Salmonella enterica TaxID=28901 RepID=A0A3Y1BRC4_SALTM|nr:ead/Ea22-like family protein [Salmonella enterica]EAA7743030.1 ead/Ea22-like family protein [Salmonella enterica subsp. enterica serovar 4,[5],12:i:-]ECG2125854.1 ead/Ea22-like family protein [Salmonella enterica subsp. enterica serovar Reading]ECG2561649.1 ead/Ea22-like family protein [Salmonella enterica subsp. enterica serovar Saintpaul]ECL7996964.1 ead/Ea22-like family protein [Salmonella enterica subsp. enterica serovar 4:i:-]EDA9018831.1 ead/Ea22-like family protein [Salmonella enteri